MNLNLSKNRIILASLVLSVMYGCSGPGREKMDPESTGVSPGLALITELNKYDYFRKAAPFYQHSITDVGSDTNRDSADFYYKLVLGENLTPDQQLLVINRLGYMKFNSADRSKAFDWFHSGIDLEAKISDENLFLVGMACYYLGYMKSDLGQVDSTLFYYGKAHKLLDGAGESVQGYNFQSLYGLASEYRWGYDDYTSAEKYYLLGGELLESGRIKIGDEDLFLFLYSMASMYGEKREFGKAIVYVERARYLADSLNSPTYMELARSLSSNIYRECEEWEQARLLNREAIDINISTDGNLLNRANHYNNLAFTLIKQKQYQEAMFYCNKGKGELMKMLQDTGLNPAGPYGILSHDDFEMVCSISKNASDLMTVFAELCVNSEYSGTIYDATGETSRAYRDYSESLRMRRISYGDFHKRVAQISHLIGDHFMRNNAPDSALHYYQSSLISGSEGFNDPDPNQNPTFKQLKNNVDLIEVLHEKASLLMDRDSDGKFGHEALHTSLDCFILCDSLIDFVWDSYANEVSRLNLEKFVSPIYEKAVEVAFLLYKQNSSGRALMNLYHFMENSRYRFLADNLTNIRAFADARVSADLENLLQESNFYIRYFGRQKEEYPEKSGYYNDKLFESLRRKDLLLDSINRSFPEVANIKNLLKTVDLDSIREKMRNSNGILIQYFSAADHFYVFSTNGKTTDIRRVAKHSDLMGDISFLTKLGEEDPLSKNGFKKFASHSLSAYTKLLEPILAIYPNNPNDRLVIIPDGGLTRLSFDALIRTMPDTTYVDYTKLDYLVRHHPVSYAFSCGMLMSENGHDLSSRRTRILALSYGETDGVDGSQSDLKWANQELDAIRGLFRGKFLKDSKATETQFKNYVADYQIIHLAIHGRVADAGNDSTMLIFRKTEGDPDDGFFLTEELYKITLNAGLVVLSSCESGLGKHFHGEGVYSMARAFANAGCRSLVSTLWQIPDRCTVPLMARFYEGLRQELPTDQALQKSKTDFLSQADQYDAHPRYWASFIPVGRTY